MKMDENCFKITKWTQLTHEVLISSDFSELNTYCLHSGTPPTMWPIDQTQSFLSLESWIKHETWWDTWRCGELMKHEGIEASQIAEIHVAPACRSNSLNLAPCRLVQSCPVVSVVHLNSRVCRSRSWRWRTSHIWPVRGKPKTEAKNCPKIWIEPFLDFLNHTSSQNGMIRTWRKSAGSVFHVDMFNLLSASLKVRSTRSCRNCVPWLQISNNFINGHEICLFEAFYTTIECAVDGPKIGDQGIGELLNLNSEDIWDWCQYCPVARSAACFLSIFGDEMQKS